MNRQDERGSVSLMLVVVMLGLLAAAGLVVDGGAKLRAVQQATAAAGEAARAATQQIISPRVTKAGDPPLAATSHATFSGGRFPLGTRRFACAHAVSENGRAVHRGQR